MSAERYFSRLDNKWSHRATVAPERKGSATTIFSKHVKVPLKEVIRHKYINKSAIDDKSAGEKSRFF